ncbi:LOB domain-containing protein 38 [Neltuma alba]|uniref:LOB domain-containing protein 38 n=1 Tax=Neltuma alba TaxID=207710 RepID=UPI0010A3CC04|nr:LOB domain-containing protein 38-like [Prosopis alba]
MSCNGCRVLRKGCSENCILRPCLQWIDSPQAQGYATVFVAKFFGRAGLMSFISNVPPNQRPALFQSLLFEACGRTVNPVNGAVGLLWTGNWHVCEAAVETVLRGGTLKPMPELPGLDAPARAPATDEASEAEVTCNDMGRIRDPTSNSGYNNKVSPGGKLGLSGDSVMLQTTDLDLRLTPSFLHRVPAYGCGPQVRRPGSPSMNSEESVTTATCLESAIGDHRPPGRDTKLLNLFI